ncbi:MAG TPA: DUF6390 family protein, partial [Candidatus Limnocylindrales bacterium]|nr:DUF6390 family protein [Candidatus Limnocylindrales bacterium]
MNPLIVASGPAAVANALATAPAAHPGDDAVLPGGPELPVSGAILFARYAYPPNELGYCGPPDSQALLQYGAEGQVDRGLLELAKGFAGAWPYLELIAHANGIADALDRRVVEAYWLGNELLDAVRAPAYGDSIEERFRGLVGRDWPHLAAVAEQAPRPHHNVHVFCVYPWVGLLRTGATDHALHVLDRCRIRWGRVRGIGGATAVVESSHLQWDGHRLLLGEPTAETVTVSEGGRALTGGLVPGDLVACHWEWACHPIT